MPRMRWTSPARTAKRRWRTNAGLCWGRSERASRGGNRGEAGTARTQPAPCPRQDQPRDFPGEADDPAQARDNRPARDSTGYASKLPCRAGARAFGYIYVTEDQEHGSGPRRAPRIFAFFAFFCTLLLTVPSLYGKKQSQVRKAAGCRARTICASSCTLCLRRSADSCRVKKNYNHNATSEFNFMKNIRPLLSVLVAATVALAQATALADYSASIQTYGNLR